MTEPQRNILQTLGYYIGLYRMYLINYGRRLVEYRSDTFVALMGGMLMQGGFVIFLEVIYARIPTLNGFSHDELFFLFGFVTLGRELNRMFFDSPFRVSFIIRRGLLDQFIVRPCSTLFQVVAMDVQINAIGGAIVGLVVMITALSHMSLVLTVWSVLWLIVAVILNVTIQYGILMSLGALSFDLLEVSSLLLPLSWFYEFNRYPLTVFHPVMQGILTFVLPYALASFYPVAFFLRPADYAWVPVVVPLLAVGLVTLSTLLFRRGLGRYVSANG